MDGRAIDTIGYRGMHSYEVAFDNWYVPGERLIGGEGGVGRGFQLQMQGFENGRLQTAARAVGLMQAAYEAAYDYLANRKLWEKPLTRLSADTGKARADGRRHPGQPPVRLPGRAADGQRPRTHKGGDGQGVRLSGG